MSNENSLYILVSEGPGKKWIRKDAGPITRWWNSPSRASRTKRWLSEHLAPGRWIGEQVSPEYSQQMDVLRNVHDQVESWTKDLSNALDRAQDARKLGKPLDSIFWLGQINNRLKLVADEKNKLEDVQNKHLEQYFQEHEQGIPDDYFETGKHRIVEAGVMDDLGRQITTWKFQKAHKNRLKEQDVALKRLLGLAKSAVGRTYSFLKDMSSALGNGDVSRYLQVLEKVGKLQTDFETEFRAIYDEYFAAMVARIKSKKIEEKEKASKIIEDANQRERERLQGAGLLPAVTTVEPIVEPAAMPEQLPEVGPVTPVEEISHDVPDLLVPEPEELAPETQPDIVRPEPAPRNTPVRSPSKPAMMTARKKKSSEMDAFILKMNHAKFHEELKKAATKNDPYLLAAMMLKYSEMIDEDDPEKSLELLSVAEGILHA